MTKKKSLSELIKIAENMPLEELKKIVNEYELKPKQLDKMNVFQKIVNYFTKEKGYDPEVIIQKIADHFTREKGYAPEEIQGINTLVLSERTANSLVYPCEVACGGRNYTGSGVRVILEYDEDKKLSKISCPVICNMDRDDGSMYCVSTANRGDCGGGFKECLILASKRKTTGVSKDLAIITTYFDQNYIPRENFKFLLSVAGTAKDN